MKGILHVVTISSFLFLCFGGKAQDLNQPSTNIPVAGNQVISGYLAVNGATLGKVASGYISALSVNGAADFSQPITDDYGDIFINSTTGGSDLWLNKQGSGYTSQINGMNNGSFRWKLYLGNDTPEAIGNRGSDFLLSAYDNNGRFLYVPLTILRSTGNVGIGTTTPSQKLDVNGSINVEGAGSYILLKDDTNENCYQVHMHNGALTATAAACK
jgi:hypothetical protein